MKKVCSICLREKNLKEFDKGKKLKEWLLPYCKQCGIRGRQNHVDVETQRDILIKIEIKEIEERNRLWVKRLIKDGVLLHPSEYICSLGECRDKAEHYHHIKYDSRSLIDPISIITPLCRQCNKYVHTRLKQGVDVTDMITDRIVLEYKLPPVFL